MIFIKILRILGFFEITLGKVNATEISFINRSVGFNNENITLHPNNTKYEISFKKCLLKISSNILETQISRNIACHNPEEKQEIVGYFISEMISLTLQDENIFLLYDTESMNLCEWIDALLYKYLIKSPHIALELQKFEISNIDSEVIKGSKYTTICLFHNLKILLDFFINKTMDTKWAPSKLFIVFLDHETSIPNEIFDFSIQRSKCVFIAELTTKNKKFVFQTYNIFPFQRNKTGFTQWKEFKGIYNLPRTKNEIFTERYKNFGAGVLHVASVCDDPPLLYLDNSGKCIGVNIEILHIISKALNFRYTIQNETEDGYYAGIQNNTLKGMFRDVYHNDKHFIINFYLAEYPESLYFDFSFPYLYDGLGFLCRIPDPIPIWRNILMPFSVSLWSLLLATVIILIFITFFLMKFGNKCENRFKLSTSFLRVSGILLRQGFDVTLKSSWHLILMSTWIIGSFIIMSAYSGSLISFMTVHSFQKRIETVREIVNSNLRVGAIDYGYAFKEILMVSKTEDLTKLAKKVEHYPFTDYELLRVIELVKSNYHLYVDGNIYLSYMQNKYNISEQTYLVKERILKGYISFLFKKNSPLTDPISSKLNRLIETGIYSKVFEKHVKMNRPRRISKEVNDRKKLQIGHLQTAFYGLFFGCFISLIILVFEKVSNRNSK